MASSVNPDDIHQGVRVGGRTPLGAHLPTWPCSHLWHKKKLAWSLPHLPAAATRSNHGVICCQAQSGSIAGNAVEWEGVSGWGGNDAELAGCWRREKEIWKQTFWRSSSPWKTIRQGAKKIPNICFKLFSHITVIFLHPQHPAEAPDCSADLPVPLLLNWTPQVRKPKGRATGVNLKSQRCRFREMGGFTV